MAEFTQIRTIWNKNELKQPINRHFFNVYVDPEPGFPFGRKGLQIASAWEKLATPSCQGMLMMDGDVAVDPNDYKAMTTAIHDNPDSVHVAPVKLWPVSTKKAGWYWGHWNAIGSMTMETTNINFYGFSFTYLPKKVIVQAIGDGLKKWTYPDDDMRVSRVSIKLKTPVNIVEDSLPKHLNY